MSNWTDEGLIRVQEIARNSGNDYSENFMSWLGKNPDIWQGFVNKTLIAKRHSHKGRFGARAILEMLRWDTMISDTDKMFKINNTYCADLSRLVMACTPELEGYFETRNSTIRDDN